MVKVLTGLEELVDPVADVVVVVELFEQLIKIIEITSINANMSTEHLININNLLFPN